MGAELALGVIGTVTGISGLAFTLWKSMREKPIIKTSDTFLFLEKQKGNRVIGKLSFSVDNLGDRFTTITRVTILFGADVEAIEGLRTIDPHSSLRFPEETGSEIQLQTSLEFTNLKKMKIIILHTHGVKASVYSLPFPIAEWDEHALWKGGPVALELES